VVTVGALLLFVLSGLTSKLAGSALFLILLIRWTYFDGLITDPDWRGQTIGSSAKWRVSVTTVVFSLGLPASFVVLATSGVNRSAITAMYTGSSSIWDLFEGACLLGIPMLIVAMPEALHGLGRPWRDSSPVPAWLAGFAALLTAAFILMLHFGGDGLAQSHVGTLAVASFGAAILLAPFYRIVVNACWEDGIAVVFDPVRWWSAWCVAYREMKGLTGDNVGPNG
jgi:hypothetical protein